MIINLKSFITLSKRIKSGLPPKRRVKSLKRVRQKKLTTNILLSILACVLILGNYVYYLANQTISQITLNLEPTELKTYFIVNSDSSVTSVEDEDLIYIGFDEEHEQYFSLFEGELSDKYDKYAYVDYQPQWETYEDLKNNLLNDNLDGVMITEETYKKIKQIDTDFENQVRIIETYNIATSIAADAVDVSKEPFNVLILGVDSRENEGDIHTNTRTDTIMIASFNPKTMQASLISIPRDTYVPLSYNDQYDKLTHAALYGVGCAIDTIENLLDIDINYYAKFNFKALIGLVDALGGVEVDVLYPFTESNSLDQPNAINVEKGLQILDGEEALAYARHRYTQNDHVRNNSQQQVLKAIVNRLTTFDTITKINALLDVLNSNMTTNFGREELLSLLTVAPHLGDLSMTNSTIEGEDYEEYVPKYDEYLWITALSDDSLEAAKEQINIVFNGGE